MQEPGPQRLTQDSPFLLLFFFHWEIREDIEDEFFWSPFVNGNDINIEVDDGVATLTGTVGSWSEREAATGNALEGGALAVTNDLSVGAWSPRLLKAITDESYILKLNEARV